MVCPFFVDLLFVFVCLVSLMVYNPTLLRMTNDYAIWEMGYMVTRTSQDKLPASWRLASYLYVRLSKKRMRRNE